MLKAIGTTGGNKMKSAAISMLVTLFLVVTAVVSTPAPAAEGVNVFIRGAIFNEAAGTIDLPLFTGRTTDNRTVRYIITESSNRDDARARGVNWAPKLRNALLTTAVQNVSVSGGLVVFPATVDFSPVRTVMPDPTDGFPPMSFLPGARGETGYSPLITTGNGIVLNAPHVANDSGSHDRLVSIDLIAMRVTMHVTPAFYHDKDIWYISTESSLELAAALEEATFAPNLNFAPGLGSNDPRTSARASIVPFVNGPRGATNPERQGLQSALLGQGPPLNVTIEHPNNRGEIPRYSPLWDVHLAVWTAAAIAAGARTRLTHHDEIARAAINGLLDTGGTGPQNPDLGGLRASGFLVNCPIMALR